MAKPDALVVFTKQPNPKNTKTRLSPPFSREEAAGLYTCFLADTLAIARQIRGVEHILAYDPPTAQDYFTALAPDFRGITQSGAELGERMHQTMVTLFAQGCRRVVLVGSDLPHLSERAIQKGFLALRRGAEVVLGPSVDGGYYLVGLTRPQAQIFDIPMSTPEVLRQTLERVERLQLRLHLLEENFDVDTAADLARLRALLESNAAIAAPCTRAWLANSRAKLTTDSGG
jgi:rSAM/selenodomain-associated transferase 1